MTTTAVPSKAERLRADGKVHAVPTHTFTVEGDHGTYLVVLGGGGLEDFALCNCPARVVECSHVQAARLSMAEAAP